MGTFILLGIKPQKINDRAWRETFRDILEISRRGELSYCREISWHGLRIPCNSLAKPQYDRGKAVNKWLMKGDLVEGLIQDDFCLVEDIKYYRDLENELKTNHSGSREFCDEEGLIIWNGCAESSRAHLWLLSIACLIYHRFPDASYIHAGNNLMEYIRATAVAGSIIGEPVAIPSPYDVGNVVDPMEEIIDDITREKEFDCMQAEDLYYWDSPTDTIKPEVEEGIKQLLLQMNKNSRSLQKHIQSLETKEARVKCLVDLLEGRYVLAEFAWKEIMQDCDDVNKLYPYLGLAAEETVGTLDIELMQVLAINYKLLLYLWDKYIRGGCLG